MSQNNLHQLVEVYNILLKIRTAGEDTLFMAECLRALYNIINDEAQQAESQENKEE